MVSRLENLTSLVKHNNNMEPERLKLLVFFIQSLTKSIDYSFDIHHFKVFSRDLEQDLKSLNSVSAIPDAPIADNSRAIAQRVLAASLEEIELAAATTYFLQNGYEQSDIESVLNPDKDLLRRAKSLLADLEAFEPATKNLAVSAVH